MKPSKIFKAIREHMNPFVDEMEFVCTISIEHKHVRYNIKKNQKGLYAFYRKGANPKKENPIYLGETIDCILSRIGKHKNSLRFPEKVNEVTGKKFDEYGIDRTQELDVYIIPYDEDIKRYDSRTIEGIFKLLLKPAVFE